MRDLWLDIRYGMRLMTRNIGFAAVVIFTLALGIGGSTAIFSIVDALLLRPLPFREPTKLVNVWNQLPAHGLEKLWLSEPEFLDYRRNQQTLESMGVFGAGGGNLTGAGEPVRITITYVSAEVLPMLGVQPLLGRLFTAEDDQPERDTVVILEHGFWQRQFGGEAGIVGKTIQLNGRANTVIGVMPRGFRYPPGPVDLWRPLAIDTANPNSRGSHYLLSIARLKPGVTQQQAAADLNRIAQQMKEENPNNYRDDKWGAYLVPLRDTYAGETRKPLWILLGAIGFVLLIACANVANLMLARAATREKEIAVRAALGGGPGRIARQLVTECVMMAACGGVLGVLFALWGIPALVALAKDRIPAGVIVGLDWRVLGFVAAISILTGILFGLAPAFQVARTDLHESLKEGTRGTTSALRRRLRDTLVVSEVALAMVLLLGAGLLLRSFQQLLREDLGYRVDRVTTFRMGLPSARYDTPEKRAAFVHQAVERIRAIPGVTSAGVISQLPLGSVYSSGSIFIEDLPPTQPNHTAGFFEADNRRVSAGYFETMGMALVRGRLFTEADVAGAPLVAVVDELFAKRAWPDGRDPIGRRIGFNATQGQTVNWMTVVGIVRHVKQYDPATEGREQAYYPYAQGPSSSMFVAYRTQNDSPQAMSAVRARIAELDGELPLYDVATMEARLADSVSLERLNLFLLSIFSATALALAAVGIYGVLAYFVAQRTREIGVRMALGAQTRDVVRLVLGHGFRVAAIGVGLGLTAGFFLTRLMRTLLFGISPTDSLTFAGVSVLLLGVALVACWIPARRAARVDPMVALRYE